MTGVLLGFTVIGAVILIGFLFAKSGAAGEEAGVALNRFAFYIAMPAILFINLAQADIKAVFNVVLLVQAASAVAAAVVYIAVARLVWRKPVSHLAAGALASSNVNANNMGLPIAAYVLGNATLVAPVILFQMLIWVPLFVSVLDISTRSAASPLWSVLLRPLRNPILIASAAGVAVAATGMVLPPVVVDLFSLVGAAAVPTVLIAFGMSLPGRRPFAAGAGRADIVLATALKTVVMPLAAYLVARFVFQVEGHELFVCVVLAALPTAQHLYAYAVRYRTGEILVRDTVLITTILSLPALVVISALLAPR